MPERPELTAEEFGRALTRAQRQRIMAGELEPGDVAALRRFVCLTQSNFARALGISVHTLRNWEQDRVTPDGPGLALLRIAARHPRIIRENRRKGLDFRLSQGRARRALSAHRRHRRRRAGGVLDGHQGAARAGERNEVPQRGQALEGAAVAGGYLYPGRGSGGYRSWWRPQKPVFRIGRVRLLLGYTRHLV
jgi:putative transcriptional regulator